MINRYLQVTQGRMTKKRSKRRQTIKTTRKAINRRKSRKCN